MKHILFETFGGLFIVLSLIFSACDDDSPNSSKQIVMPEMYEDLSCPFDYDKTDSDNVLGKWKLVRTTRGQYGSPEYTITDYSCNNITYEFTTDGRFIIESDVEEIPDSVYSYKGGENIVPDPLGLRTGNMSINDSIIFYSETAYGTLHIGPVQGQTVEKGGPMCGYGGYLLRIE